MGVLDIVVSGGFGLLALILGLSGRSLLMEVRGVRTDLQAFKLSTERRLTTTEVQLENLQRKA